MAANRLGGDVSGKLSLTPNKPRLFGGIPLPTSTPTPNRNIVANDKKVNKTEKANGTTNIYRFTAGEPPHAVQIGQMYRFDKINLVLGRSVGVSHINSVFDTMKRIYNEKKDLLTQVTGDNSASIGKLKQTVTALKPSLHHLDCLVVRIEKTGPFQSKNAAVVIFRHSEGIMAAIPLDMLVKRNLINGKDGYDCGEADVPYCRPWPKWVIDNYGNLIKITIKPGPVDQRDSQDSKDDQRGQKRRRDIIINQEGSTTTTTVNQKNNNPKTVDSDTSKAINLGPRNPPRKVVI